MYQDNFNLRVPGEMDGMQFVDKQICMHADYHIRDRIAITIAPNTGDLDKGTILGITTADSLFRPVRRAAVQAAVANGATTVTVSAADIANAKFAVGNAVAFVKADGTGAMTVGTISAINTTTNVITFSTATTGTFAVNDFFFVQDGSEKAMVVLAEVVQDAASNKVGVAYVAGKFFLTALVGVDSIVTKDLSARSIPYGNNPYSGAAESLYIV